MGEQDVVRPIMGEHQEGGGPSQAPNTGGEAGEEEGGVRGEDAEPCRNDPQGGGGAAGCRGGEAAGGDDQVPGDGCQAPVTRDYAQEEIPQLFWMSNH